jgi:hypothetical protein
MPVDGSHLCHSPPNRPSITVAACFFTFAAMPHALTQPQLPSPRDQTKSWSDASLALQDAGATAFAPLPPTVLDGARAARAGSCEQDSPPGLTVAVSQGKAVSCCACHRTPRGFLMIGGRSACRVRHGVRREAERHAALRRWHGARRVGAVGRRTPHAWLVCAPEPDFQLGGKAVSSAGSNHNNV